MNTTINGFPKHRLDAACAALAKAHARLARAAAKAGQVAPASPVLTVVAERVESRCTECQSGGAGAGGVCPSAGCGGNLVRRIVVDLELTSARLALAGWEFLAVVEQLTAGNLIKQVPGARVAEGELTPWRDGAIGCDHCSTTRRRSETFILRADGSDTAVLAGTYKQVGRNCLEAFFGGKSAAAILGQIGWPALVAGAGDDGEGGWGGGAHVYDPLTFLALVATVIRTTGWTSRTATRDSGGQATADIVLQLLTNPAAREAAREAYSSTAEDKARANDALTWAREFTPANDYETNLSLVAREDVLDHKHAGILASAIPAHARALGRAADQRQQATTFGTSKHVGTIGQRLDLELVVEKSIPVPSDYGRMNIVTYRDKYGNAYLWRTGALHGNVGATVQVRGTIKKHSEFHGELQTELTRCSIKEASRSADTSSRSVSP